MSVFLDTNTTRGCEQMGTCVCGSDAIESQARSE